MQMVESETHNKHTSTKRTGHPYCGEVKREETRVMGLSSSEDPMIVARVILIQCQHVTDGRTD